MICTGAEKVILSVLVFPKRVEEWEDGEKGISDTPDYWEPEYDEQLQKWFICPQHTGAGASGLLHEDISPIQWANVLYQMDYFHQYEIKSHPELQKRMIEHYTEFWNENVLGEKEPEPQNYDDIKCLVTEPVGTILADDNIERIMAEYKNIKSEISGSGPLAKRADQIKIAVLDYMRNAGFIEDDESKDKWILRNQSGQKIASYGKNKNGVFTFR
jgi:hypothetical protein